MFLLLFYILILNSFIHQFVMSNIVSPQNSLKFFNTVGKLKLLKRTGWVDKGEKDHDTSFTFYNT
jgi:hypothetical protein